MDMHRWEEANDAGSRTIALLGYQLIFLGQVLDQQRTPAVTWSASTPLVLQMLTLLHEVLQLLGVVYHSCNASARACITGHRQQLACIDPVAIHLQRRGGTSSDKVEMQDPLEIAGARNFVPWKQRARASLARIGIPQHPLSSYVTDANPIRKLIKQYTHDQCGGVHNIGSQTCQPVKW
jgi:hypothetical protein